MDMAAFDNNIWNDYYSFYESEINWRKLPTHIHKDSFREMFLNNVLDLIYEDMSYPLALARTRLRVTEVLNFIADVHKADAFRDGSNLICERCLTPAEKTLYEVLY